MGPAGLQLDVEQGRRPERLDRVVVGHRVLAACDDGEPPVTGRMPVDRRVDGATQRVHVALYERVVTLVDRTLLERPLEP